jgi:hypothetical protein
VCVCVYCSLRHNLYERLECILCEICELYLYLKCSKAKVFNKAFFTSVFKMCCVIFKARRHYSSTEVVPLVCKRKHGGWSGKSVRSPFFLSFSITVLRNYRYSETSQVPGQRHKTIGQVLPFINIRKISMVVVSWKFWKLSIYIKLHFTLRSKEWCSMLVTEVSLTA